MDEDKLSEELSEKDIVTRKDIVNIMVFGIWRHIGCDRPVNHDTIVEFILKDVEEAADENFHSGDVAIGFRRWIEKDLNL